MKIGILKRDITREEFPWLEFDLYKGSILYKFEGDTFEAISKEGIAVTLEYNQYPFFEIPNDSIEFQDYMALQYLYTGQNV